MSVTVAVDIMGGDQGPLVTLPAIQKALDQFPDLSMILMGDRHQIPQALLNHERISVQHTEDVVAMDADPIFAIRRQKKSSMRLTLNAVASGEASSCLSAGNTGALMGMAKFVLRMYPGIERPAILGVLPSKKIGGSLYMLDLGANVSATPTQLLQFATMGQAVCGLLENNQKPRVALLNIGHEAVKGNELVKEASLLIEKDPSIHYTGFVEASDLFNDVCDVLVCDGFVGNSVLKASEGAVKTMYGMLRQGCEASLLGRLVGLGLKKVLGPLRQNYSPDRRNGALLLGLKGAVIKSHGNTSSLGFLHAIEVAYRVAKYDMIEKIGEKLSCEPNKESS